MRRAIPAVEGSAASFANEGLVVAASRATHQYVESKKISTCQQNPAGCTRHAEQGAAAMPKNPRTDLKVATTAAFNDLRGDQHLCGSAARVRPGIQIVAIPLQISIEAGAAYA